MVTPDLPPLRVDLGPDATIHRGDNLAVLGGLADGSADFVLTDPPYLVDYSGRWNSEWGTIEGDDDPSWVIPTFAEIHRVMRPDSLCVSFYGWPHADVFVGAWKKVGLRPVSHLVWVKNGIGLGHYTRSAHETGYLLAKGRPPLAATARSTVFPWTRVVDPVHPNQKPVDALVPVLDRFTRPGDLVLDPWMGSGGVGVACRRRGRRFLGIEVDPGHFESARSRIAAELTVDRSLLARVPASRRAFDFAAHETSPRSPTIPLQD